MLAGKEGICRDFKKIVSKNNTSLKDHLVRSALYQREKNSVGDVWNVYTNETSGKYVY